MKGIVCAALAICCGAPALAQTISLSSTKANIGQWVVSETSNGAIVTAPAKFIGQTHFGQIPGFTIPFDKQHGDPNDGFWHADIGFTLPANATGVKLHITGVGVDDRCVVELNGQIVSDSGIYAPGAGAMTYFDGGPNEPRNFINAVGLQNTTVTTGFVAGNNDLRLVVNNTGHGIRGKPEPRDIGGETQAGIRAWVTYTNRLGL